METFSLSRLNEYIRRAIVANFIDPVWITGEILQVKINKGHVYIDLVEKSNEAIIAQSSLVLWKTNFVLLQKNTVIKLEELVKEGNEVKLQVIVDYNIRYGLKLIIQNIDPSYTLGKIAQQKLEIVAKLKADNLWQLNQNLDLPIVIKKIAVITSLSSAGKIDFEHELTSNQFGYSFNLTFFQAGMQGEFGVNEVVSAFQEINKSSIKFDLIVIVRGGGAKMDLVNFDHYDISKQISLSSIPVLTGIGHFIDESIADMNAFKSLKTPTGVASFILQWNNDFDRKLDNNLERISISFQKILYSEKHILESLLAKLTLHSKVITSNAEKSIEAINTLLNKNYASRISEAFIELLELEKVIYANDPKVAMQNGFVLIQQSNKRVKRKNELEQKYEIETIFSDGRILSTIK